MRNIANNNRLLVICFFAVVLLAAGCAEQRSLIKDIYPSHMRDDAPLVLAVPGINLPNCITPQANQFGELVRMLADRGIPSRVLAYDTADIPLSSTATLTFDEASIARTVVGPMMIEEIKQENARRAKIGLPPVKEVCVYSYSQGSVIAGHLLQRYHRFKTTCKELSEKCGLEWNALQDDPEFVSLISATMDFLLLDRIKVQKEALYKSDPKLEENYARVESNLRLHTDRFMSYLHDPKTIYPDVSRFEPPETGKYPKQYDKIKNWFDESAKRSGVIKQFLADYAACRPILDVHFSLFSSAGSFYGSPVANRSYGFLEFSPAFADTKLRQIKDSRLGSDHQLQETKKLLKLNELGQYPFAKTDTLFIVGVNGDEGDGFIDQPSAHLADHAVVRVSGQKTACCVSVAAGQLPHLPVVGLKMMHIPEDSIFGLFGHRWGAAYMEKGNPVFSYLMAFIDKDWNKIEQMERSDGKDIRRFVLIVVVDKKKPDGKTLSVVKKGSTENVLFDVEAFYNPDNNATVWSGKFTGKEEHMYPFRPGNHQGVVTFEVSEGAVPGAAVEIPVYPGCNTTVKVEAE